MDRVSHRAPRTRRRRLHGLVGLAVVACVAVGVATIATTIVVAVAAGSTAQPSRVAASPASSLGVRDLVERDPAPVDRRATRLLAIIALICVVGVTSGIIRAILAQRANTADARQHNQ